MITAAMFALREEFGFGQDRLMRWRVKFDELVQNTEDLDYMGEHYVEMQDYAAELVEKMGQKINIDLLAATQLDHDKGRKEYKMCRVQDLADILEENGYEDAAKFVREL